MTADRQRLADIAALDAIQDAVSKSGVDPGEILDAVTSALRAAGRTVPHVPDDEPHYIAHFTPEAWVRDQAVEVDAEGPQEWDCTAYATDPDCGTSRRGGSRLDYLDWLERCGKGALAGDGVLDTDDVFQDDPAAPEWVRGWRGPFTITVRYAKEGE